MQTYSELVRLTHQGDYDAYSKLCVYFLEFVPLIEKDLDDLIKLTHVEKDDLFLEGSLAVCETLSQEVLNSRDESATEFLSQKVAFNIMRHLIILLKKELTKDEYEKTCGISYEVSYASLYNDTSSPIPQDEIKHLVEDTMGIGEGDSALQFKISNALNACMEHIKA